MTMNQHDFTRAVARATGESADTIARCGFVLLTPVPFEREPPRVNYDDLLEGAMALARPQVRKHAAAESRPTRTGRMHFQPIAS
jgi:hypothetical protein